MGIIDKGFPGGMLDRSLILRAMRFACEKHSTSPPRKGSGIPYFWHTVDVAVTLVWADQDPEVVAAGFLHDVVEDCGVQVETLARLFGKRAATLVAEVTNVTTRADGNRKQRQEIERRHLGSISPEGMTVKLADSLCNARDVVRDDPRFAPVYLAEKRLLIPLLKAGHPVLYELAWQAACKR